MPDAEPKEKIKSYSDEPVRCRNKSCERLFKGLVFREFDINRGVKVLIDTDGDVVYEFVKVCKCGTVYHWHTSEKHMQENTSAFNRLMRHYTTLESKNDGAIIATDNSTG